MKFSVPRRNITASKHAFRDFHLIPNSCRGMFWKFQMIPEGSSIQFPEAEYYRLEGCVPGTPVVPKKAWQLSFQRRNITASKRFFLFCCFSSFAVWCLRHLMDAQGTSQISALVLPSAPFPPPRPHPKHSVPQVLVITIRSFTVSCWGLIDNDFAALDLRRSL